MPADLRAAVEAKLAITRHRRWKPELWRLNLDEIEQQYASTMASWIDPAVLPPFGIAVRDIAARLRQLRLD